MAKRTRHCIDCKVDINHRGNRSIRCVKCQNLRRDAFERDQPDRPKCADDDGTCSASRLKRGRCSRHYYTARRDNDLKIPQQPRPCATCGVTFTPVRSDAVCCSNPCNWRRQDKARLVDYPERICASCGIEYKPKKSSQRYCRFECPDTPSIRWMIRNRKALSNARHLRRERLYGNTESVGVSTRDWERLVNRHGGRCFYCNTLPDELTMDHVIPAVRGGRHAIGNIVPACRSCNSAKHDMLLVEFRHRRSRTRPKRLAAKPRTPWCFVIAPGASYEQITLPIDWPIAA